MLLRFYSFKTLCFYSQLPVCESNFLACYGTAFTNFIKTIRQIKRLIYPLIDVWHTLALKGNVCLCVVLQHSYQPHFTL